MVETVSVSNNLFVASAYETPRQQCDEQSSTDADFSARNRSNSAVSPSQLGLTNCECVATSTQSAQTRDVQILSAAKLASSEIGVTTTISVAGAASSMLLDPASFQKVSPSASMANFYGNASPNPAAGEKRQHLGATRNNGLPRTMETNRVHPLAQPTSITPTFCKQHSRDSLGHRLSRANSTAFDITGGAGPRKPRNCCIWLVAVVFTICARFTRGSCRSCACGILISMLIGLVLILAIIVMSLIDNKTSE